MIESEADGIRQNRRNVEKNEKSEGAHEGAGTGTDKGYEFRLINTFHNLIVVE